MKLQAALPLVQLMTLFDMLSAETLLILTLDISFFLFHSVAVSVIAVLAPFNPLIYIGSAVVLSGNIVMLDSHKWFKNKDISALKVEDNDNKIEKRKKQLKELLLKGSINKEEYDDAIKSIEQFKTID